MTFKSKTKYTWEGWESSGREAWVFSVDYPRELMGVHAKLIDNELKPNEKTECCVYSPRVSATMTPFGLATKGASHGLCVTDHRFIISQNYHTKGLAPSLFSVSFEEVLYFTIGKALLLGWFCIKSTTDQKDVDRIITFGATGRHHFEKAIRSYKKHSLTVNSDDPDKESFPPGSFIHKIENKTHADYLKTLLAQGERCFMTFSCRYLWEKALRKPSLFGKKKAAYSTSQATLLLTNKALLSARDSLGDFIGTGVELQNIPLDKIKGVSIAEERFDGHIIRRLKVALTGDDCTVDMPLVAVDGTINDFVTFLGSLLVSRK